MDLSVWNSTTVFMLLYGAMRQQKFYFPTVWNRGSITFEDTNLFHQRNSRLTFSPLSFLYFTCHFWFVFLHFLYVFVLFVYFLHVYIISFKFLNWKTLYFKSPLTKRSPASFSRSNSEVDFCPFVSCLERRIQYWSIETKYSVQYWGSPMPIMPKNGWISWNLEV